MSAAAQRPFIKFLQNSKFDSSYPIELSKLGGAIPDQILNLFEDIGCLRDKEGNFTFPSGTTEFLGFLKIFLIFIFQDENAKILGDLAAKFDASEPTEGMKLITSRSLTPAGDNIKVFHPHAVGILNNATLLFQKMARF